VPSSKHGVVGWVAFSLTALVVSAFPEKSKREGWPSFYASPAAHVVSGWVETFVSAALFVAGLLLCVNGFNQGAGWTYVVHQPTLTPGDFLGVGALGYLSYMLTPVAWITVYCFGEGIVRALDAAISERMLGMALAVLPWRAYEAATRGRQRTRELMMLGPDRPDEVVVWEGSPVALTVFASRRKPWASHQVIEHHGEFFRLLGVTMARQGGHGAFRYDFGRLEAREVIRGALVHYVPSERPAADAGSEEAATGPEVRPRAMPG
jgi:hypothetical protein